MIKYTKEDAIRTVVECAKIYQRELMDKVLLFACTDKQKRVVFVELSFKASNYLHLTGLKVKHQRNGTELAAVDFFNRCLNHKLSPDDFEFAEDGTTHLKLRVLPSMMNGNLSAKMIGDYNSMRPKLYTEKLAGGTKACMGFVMDRISKMYVPNTVLNEDVRNIVHQPLRVIAVYRKDKDAAEYEELTYAAKGVVWDGILYPKEYDYLLGRFHQ